MDPKVYAVVPAAGRSKRMGTQKLLLPFAGTTVIGHVVRTILSAPVAGVVAVVSPRGTDVAAEATRWGAMTTVNPDPEADMLSSVRCGLLALPGACDAALVALGDQPTLRPQWIVAMIDALGSRPEGIVVPTYAGARGHPLLIAARWFDEVLTRYDGVGLRGLVAQHPESVIEIPIADERVLHDMDDPEAYRRALIAPDD